MNRPASIIFAVFALAGATTLRGQGINPRVPPPPPQAAPAAPAAPAASPSPSADTPAAPATNSAPAAASKPIDPTVPPPPPPADDPPEEAATPSGPAFDPLHAQRSIDIGTFYMKKGVYDAAIDRFIEAANYQPSLAMPWKLLGEAYEKKHEWAKAVDAYNKYLQIVPRAADAARIQKTVSDLQEKSAPESSKQ